MATWLRVTRDELNLDTIAGRIDVKNEFGKTTLVVGRALAERPHRVVSESGRIPPQQRMHSGPWIRHGPASTTT